MSRPQRIQYAGALYHVTSRGNRRGDIYLDQRDHLIWLDLLALTANRFQFRILAYCMMPNHFHLTVQTTEANLSQGMHYLNSCFAQHFNKRHNLVGHVIQGRFHAVLITQQVHMLELSRYVPLNPVRSRLVQEPEEWAWSSYRAHAGLAIAPDWLETEAILAPFSGDLARRRAAFTAFVQSGRDMDDPLRGMDEHTSLCGEAPLALDEYAQVYPDRAMAMAAAIHSRAYALIEVAKFFGVSTKTVSRAAKRYRQAFAAEPVSDFGVDPKVDTGSAMNDPTSVGITTRKVV